MLDDSGWTPLHLAAQQGRTDLMEMLIAQGADLHARANIVFFGGSMRGLTPLHLAARANHPKAVELLLARGADVHCELRDGFQPLHFAQGKEVAALLLEAGAEINAKARDGATPLTCVSAHSKSDSVELLRPEEQRWIPPGKMHAPLCMLRFDAETTEP